MSQYDKKYDAFKLFQEIISQSASAEHEQSAPQSPVKKPSEEVREEYYEIEYDSSPIPGAGKFVLRSSKPQKPQMHRATQMPYEPQRIQEPEKDEVRELFNQMRDIARAYRAQYRESSQFYDRKVQQENAVIFYQQGIFMKDFEDDYPTVAPYSSYYPNYQMMGYEQLRTYFTWRSRVRKGIVADIPVSYAFVYIYELLSNIGVESPVQGLEKLMFFWNEYSFWNKSLDRYVLKWLKDYHIYYPLPHSFGEFIKENRLTLYYAQISEPEGEFELYCTASKYDIRKSRFFIPEREDLMKRCFGFVVERLKEGLAPIGVTPEEAVFQASKNRSPWTPFQGALFYPWMRREDCRVVLSEKEVYLCSNNRWTRNASLTTENGKRFAGYLLKQTEAVLRRKMNYKYKLSANAEGLDPILLVRLQNAGLSLDKLIEEAVEEFYREETKTVVKVDVMSLAKIRQEALQTQEKLIVEEEETQSVVFHHPATESVPVGTEERVSEVSATENVPEEYVEITPWEALRRALSEAERTALGCILQGSTQLKQFADEQGIMLEVLMDGINEKAMDYVGDVLLDEEFNLYDDYAEEVRRMAE